MSALKKYRYILNMKRLLAMDAFSVCGNFLKCKILFDNQIHVYFFSLLFAVLISSPVHYRIRQVV